MESWRHWDDFLKIISRDNRFELSDAETASFLLQFARQNLGKSLEEISQQLPLTENPLANHKKRMTKVYSEFSKNGIELKPKNNKSKPLQEWLETQYSKWLLVQDSDSALSSGTTETPIDWRKVSLAMLEAEEQQRLTTNQLMRDDDERFDLEEIHVPLALVERKKPAMHGEQILPEQGSRLYEPEYEEKQRFEHEQFLLDILKDGKGKHKGKRIAIIGEPGAGKTTLLRKIAFWVKDNTEYFPISISLADLQEFTLEEYLLQVWLKTALKVRQVKPEMEDALDELFKSERVYLLLDGVDEMPAQGEEPLWAISNQLKGWVGQARVVLTCRLNVWEANRNVLADNFEIYRTLDFSYGDRTMPDRVGEFIAKWFNNKPNLGQELRQALDEPGKERIKDLAKNPLRLALLCSTWNLWRDRGGLPDTKAKLYQGFVEKFYDWKGREFPTNYTQREQLNLALGELAKLAIDQTASRFRLKHSLVYQVLEKPDEGLFELALQLGWLNKVGLAAESPDETVYAFWHPTFEEYFAALAVGERDFFLPRNHVDSPVYDKRYRIFEPPWKEVILLWLGMEINQDFRNEKDEFIETLLDFQDGCQNLYGSKAYFLAIYGIEEFTNCIYTDRIRTAMKSKDIDEIDDVTVQNKFDVSIASSALVLNNHDLMTKTFFNIHVFFLSRLLKTLGFNSTKLTRPKLIELSQISYLNNLLREQQYSMGTSRNLSNLSLIELFDCLGSSENIWIRRESLRIILELASQNITKVTADICDFLHKSSYKEIDFFLAWLLEKIELNNLESIEVIVRIIMTINDDCIRFIGFDKIKNIVDSALLQKVVYYLITIAQSSLQIDSNLNDYCYKICLHCAQNLPYPDFYQAWHQDNLTNYTTSSLNLANLPQLLAEAINDRPDLCNKVKLICIDSHKFGNPENPATKIYNEMRLQGCDKSEDGKPKTMAELQDYWDELRIKSDIPLFFICYDSTALSGTPTEFSDSFLKALSKFDRAICILCETEDIPLQTFSPSQPNLIAEIVAWISEMME